ncbi:Agamous-like MADS-box protein AGL103 [Linum perenne]
MSGSPSLKKRRRTLKNKAAELSTLCGIDVAYVCFEPNGRLDLWPEDHNKVNDIILRYTEVVKSMEKSPDAPASSTSSSDVIQNDFDDELQLLRKAQDWLSKRDVFTQQELATAFRFSQHMEESIFTEMESLEAVDKTLKRKTRTIDWFRVPKIIDFLGSWPTKF